MEKKNTFWTEMARPVVVLVVICLVASALLGFTNAKTAPVIEENIRIEAEKTRKEVLPAASEFTELEVSEELKANGVTGIFEGDNGTGYVVTAEKTGYGGAVVVTVGFDTEGKIQLVSFLYSGGYSEENGLETAQNMLTANPDIKCIIGTCDSHVIGASQAMTVLGMDDPKSVIMGAVDGSTTAMESIKNGGSIVCTGMNDTHAFGVLSTRILVAYLNDGTLPESNNIIQQPVICTIDNDDEYYSG